MASLKLVTVCLSPAQKDGYNIVEKEECLLGCIVFELCDDPEIVILCIINTYKVITILRSRGEAHGDEL